MKTKLMALSAILIGIFAFTLTSCKKEAPKPKASFTYTGGEVKAPAEVKFSNKSTDATSYLWNFGDGTTSTDQNPIKTYTEKGKYTVSLKAINDEGDHSYSTNIRVYGDVTAWQADQIEFNKEAWGTKADVTVYLAVYNTNNQIFDYTGDESFVTKSILTSTEKLTYTLTKKLNNAMTSNSKMTFKLLIAPEGSVYVNPATDELVYSIVVKGSDIIPSANNPYPYLYKDANKSTVFLNWID